MWRADGSIGLGSVLCLIANVWEVELFLLRSHDHIFITVFRIVHVVIAVDRDKSDAFRLVIMLNIDQSLLVGLCIGAVVAAEHNNDSLLVAETLQTIVLAVYSFELKVDCCASHWKSNCTGFWYQFVPIQTGCDHS